MRKLILTTTFLVAPALIGTAPSAHALTNGSFETGTTVDPIRIDPTGWTMMGLGAASFAGTTLGFTPSDGSRFAVIYTNDEFVTEVSNQTSALDVFQALEGGSQTEIDDIIAKAQAFGVDVTDEFALADAAAIYQDITVNAGDELSFDWRFLTNEDPDVLGPFTSEDFAYFSLTNDILGAASIVVGDLVASENPSVYALEFDESGWATYTHTFAASGTYRVGFGVFNHLFEEYESGLFLDNFELTLASGGPGPGPGGGSGIPTPAAAGLIALGALAAMRRKA